MHEDLFFLSSFFQNPVKTQKSVLATAGFVRQQATPTVEECDGTRTKISKSCLRPFS